MVDDPYKKKKNKLRITIVKEVLIVLIKYTIN